jgi:hypothetical protein
MCSGASMIPKPAAAMRCKCISCALAWPKYGISVGKQDFWILRCTSHPTRWSMVVARRSSIASEWRQAQRIALNTRGCWSC